MNGPRPLLYAAVALLLLWAVLFGILRGLYGQRAAYIHIRWAPTVTDAARQGAEQRHHLTPVEFKEQRTWLYLLTQVSSDGIRQLVTDPAVEDTHYINRGRFTIASSAERGDYPTTRPVWIAETLEFALRIALYGGLVALVVGLYRFWQQRGSRGVAPVAHKV